jgi:predicted ATPase with chaperone activity
VELLDDGRGTAPSQPALKRHSRTLAHRGVLFIDSLPEFPRSVLESLRQPLEDGYVAVARVGGHALFPARFQLVGTMNICPPFSTRSSTSVMSSPAISWPEFERLVALMVSDAERFRGAAKVRGDRSLAEKSARADDARA